MSRAPTAMTTAASCKLRRLDTIPITKVATKAAVCTADEVPAGRELTGGQQSACLIAEVPRLYERADKQAPSILMILSGNTPTSRSETGKARATLKQVCSKKHAD